MPLITQPLFDRAQVPEVMSELADANAKLSSSKSVPDDVAKLVQTLSETADRMTPADVASVDPYLVVAFQRGLIGALRALDLKKATDQRKHLRVSLERMRQALRDAEEGFVVSEEEPTKDVVRWLVEVLDVPASRIADLVAVNPRTFQRWVSVTDPASPHADDALTIRVIARIANHLRHAYTGPGVVRWLERPHPELSGKSPGAILRTGRNIERLVNLAAAARSSAAT